MKKNSTYRLDIIPGIVIAIFALLYISMIPGIQVFDGMGATPLTNHFVPYLWGGVLLFLSVWLIVRGSIKYKRFKEAGGVPQKLDLKAALSDKREVIASFIALALYVGLMEAVGFVPTTIVYTFVQILILTPRERWKKNYVPAAITAVIAGCLLYYIFKYLLNVLLPNGVLSIIGL